MIWFLLLVAVGWFFAFRAALRVFRGEEVYIGGKRPKPILVAVILVLFLIVIGIFAATQLGFIPDHAP